MKDSTEYAPHLKKLCNRLKRQGTSQKELDLVDPTTALVAACLSAVTTENKARTVLNRFRSFFVDYNELRVSRPDEIVEILGNGFPHAGQVAQQITELLKQVYNKCNTLNLEDLSQGNKRQARTFLEELESSNRYVVSRVMLLSIGAHAFPVHDQMLNMLRKEKVVAPGAGADDVQGFMERQISAAQIRTTYAMLRRHADIKSRRSAATATKRTSSDKTKKTPAKTSRQTKKKKKPDS